MLKAIVNSAPNHVFVELKIMQRYHYNELLFLCELILQF